MLCKCCSAITLTLPVDKVLLRTYEDIKELETSGSSGCAFCALICASHRYEHTLADKHSKGRVRKDYTHSSISVFHYLNQSIDLESNICWECHESDSISSGSFRGNFGGFFTEQSQSLYEFQSLVFFLVAHLVSDNTAAQYFSGRQLKSNVPLREKFALITKWLSLCTSAHPACPVSSAVPLPSRVIHVHGKGSSSNPYLFVPEVSNLGTYAALSYCWGIFQNNTLTKDTMADKLNGIPLASLPQTIQDAITVTKELGISYLWVDALCILQDSPEDWQVECSNMGQIYSHALVTIEASGTDHSDGGLFIQRESQKLPPAKLKFRSSEGVNGEVFVRYGPVYGQQALYPLSKRGWTLQEHLLSQRVIAFGAKQLSWECKSTYADEEGSILAEQS